MNSGVPMTWPVRVRPSVHTLEHRLRDAEVHDLRDFLSRARPRDEDVVRLEIAMNDSQLVRGAESVGDLSAISIAAIQPRGASRESSRDSGSPSTILHHEVDQPSLSP
jgi:hypothetical protein